jgi:hypothetical protein
LQRPDNRAAARTKTAHIQILFFKSTSPPIRSRSVWVKTGIFSGRVPITESTVNRIIWGFKKEKDTVPKVAAQERKNVKRLPLTAAAIKPERLPFQGRFIKKILLRLKTAVLLLGNSTQI